MKTGQSKPKLGIFGNCQADEIGRLFSLHRPLLEKYELIRTKPVFLMTQQDREQFVGSAVALDIFICQFTGENYAPATTENLRKRVKGRVLEFPSLWFSGHLPDLFYPTGNTVNGAPSSYHSAIIASAFDRGLSQAQTESIYEHPGAISYHFLSENYWHGLAELRRREQRCDVTVSDIIIKSGPGIRMFHTMNHPNRAIILHVANQLLRLLAVQPIDDDGEDHMNAIAWPITAAAANLFGVVKERPFSFGSKAISLSAMIEAYFRWYRNNPTILQENRDHLHPPWLAI